MTGKRKWVGLGSIALSVILFLFPAIILAELVHLFRHYGHVPPMYEILDQIPAIVLGEAGVLLVLGIGALAFGVVYWSKRK